jgi:hypothetical protein
MKKYLKLGAGLLVGAGLAVAAHVVYQNWQDQRLRQLLAAAKADFNFEDLLTSWLVEEPLRDQVYQGGLIRSDGTVVTFEIDGDTLKVRQTFDTEAMGGI